MSYVNYIRKLEELFGDAARKGIYHEVSGRPSVEVTRSTRDKFGEYQCNSALKFAKELRKSPMDVAKLMLESLDDEHDLIERAEIAPPGFINIHVNKQTLGRELVAILKDPKLGVQMPERKRRIICEFSSPNIAKQMHVGHLRSTIIGDSIARLLEFLGHTVIRLNHIGDWGTQFGMLITYLKKFHPDVIQDATKCELDDLTEWYKSAKKKFDESAEFKKCSQKEVVRLQSGDPVAMQAWRQICEISRVAFNRVYSILGVKLTERGESFYNPLLAEVVSDFESKELITVDDGAKCVFIEGFTNREGNPLPLILQKRDGGFNYYATDLAGFRYRIRQDKVERIIIVTDVGQTTHFGLVRQAAIRVGYLDPASVRFDHVTFGLVLNPDGKKFKTREGTTENLQDLLDEAIVCAKGLLVDRDVEDVDEAARVLGIGSVKYADLSCNRIKDYTFSYDRMLKFEGNTAAFIIYAYVRIQSIKSRGGFDESIIGKDRPDGIELTHPSEVALAVAARQFGEALADMDEELLPNRLTDYLFHLAEKFHAFFRDCRVLESEQQESRLLLAELVGRIIKQGLDILGIGVLERM